MNKSENRDSVLWAIPSPARGADQPVAAWEARDRILSEMQRLGASREDIRSRVGPDPPRINYGLSPLPPPHIPREPGEQWAQWAAATQKHATRERATYRQGYCAFMGEYPEPPPHREHTIEQLIEWAARRLFGHSWKEITPLDTPADDLENTADSIRKAVTEFFKWTRLDPESIATNRTAEARRIILEIETKELDVLEGSGPQLTDKDRERLTASRSALAQLIAEGRTTETQGARPRGAVGRPKMEIDHKRVFELHRGGATLAAIAAELQTSKTTIHRILNPTVPKSTKRK